MQHDFILLDRSGSMMDLWTEALGSINAYVKKLADDKVDTGVTIATFDKDQMRGVNMSFDILRDRITPQTMHPLTDADAKPRGWTPLNDAVGRIVALAEKGNYDKVAIIIMTDGRENCSEELNTAQAKALLDRCRAKNWQVIFLGANFDNAEQAASLGNFVGSTARVAKTKLAESTVAMASMRSSYAATGARMAFTDDQKAGLARE